MGTFQVNSPAATAVGVDILSGNKDAMKPYPRIISWYAYVGSSVIGNAACDLYVGDTRVATNVRNTTVAQAADMSKDPMPARIAVRAGEYIRAEITVAGATNATQLIIHTVP